MRKIIITLSSHCHNHHQRRNHNSQIQYVDDGNHGGGLTEEDTGLRQPRKGSCHKKKRFLFGQLNSA